MRKIYKNVCVFSFIASLVGTLSASEPGRDPQKTHLISSRAMIQEDFSGLEATPIIKAFYSWMEETTGDISIDPPSESDLLFYDMIIKGSSYDLQVFDFDLKADATNRDPWQKGCRQTFYVIRVTSSHPTVRAIDSAGASGEAHEVLGFTFSGCNFKFIAVVADRMRDEEMMYTTMLHELGHMWGLPDNKAGKNSIMNGSWPASHCVTRKDIVDLYSVNKKPGMEPPKTGCKSEKD